MSSNIVRGAALGAAFFVGGLLNAQAQTAVKFALEPIAKPRLRADFSP